MFKNSLLRIFPDFRCFFFSRVVSLVGDTFSAIAVSWWIVSQGTDESKMQFGLMMATVMVPRILFGPLFGVIADRFSRKSCMIVADAARLVLAALMAGLMSAGLMTIPALFVLCFLIAFFGPLFEAAEGAALMQITSHEHIGRATALHSMAFNISNLAGLFLGASVVAALGTAAAFWVNAASFLLSLALVLLIKNPLAATSSGTDVQKSPLHDFAQGVRYLLSQRALLWLTVFFAVSNFIASPLMIIIPLQVKFMFNESVFWVAVFEGAISAGALAMGVYLARHTWRYNAYSTEMWIMIAVGVVCALLGFTYNKLLTAGMYFLLGTGITISHTVIGALFQKTVDDEFKGRFFSLIGALATVVMPFGFVMSGFLAEMLSIPQILVIFGGASAVSALAIPFLPRVPESGAIHDAK